MPTQVAQGDTGRRAVHLAELLALGMSGVGEGPVDERVQRPTPATPAQRWLALAGVAAGGLAAGAAALTAGHRLR